MMISRLILFLQLTIIVVSTGMAGGALAAEWQALYPSPTPNELFDAYSPDGQIFYLVGGGGTILRYDGTEFITMESPTKLPLYAIDGSGPSDIWAVGGDTATDSPADQAVLLHFDGNNWTETAAPDTSGTTYPFSDVYAASPTNVWAVMKNQDRVARWNGSNWSFQTTLPAFDQGFNKVCGASANAIWLVGDYNQMAFWNGTTLTNISKDPNLGYGDYTACWAADDDSLFTGTNTGGLTKWDHLGNDLPISHNQGIKTVSGITGNSSSDVYFLGYAGFFIHYDGLSTAQLISPDSWRRNAMVRTSSGNWIIGADQGVQNFDSGELTTLSEPSPLASIETKNAFVQNGLWLVPFYLNSNSAIEILHSGANNSLIYPPNDSSWSVRGANSVGTDDFRIGVYSYNDANDYIYQYSGGNWTRWIPPGGNRIMHDILSTPGGQIFTIFNGTTGGIPCLVEAYEQQCYSGAGNVFTALTACDETVYAVGNGGAIAVYSNGAWSAESSGTAKDLVAAACSDNQVYAVGKDRTAIWKSTGSWQPVSGLSGKDYFDFTDITHVSGAVFTASLKAPQGSQWMSFVYSLDSGAAAMDLGWIGPNVRIDAMASDGISTYALGRPNVLMYSGKRPNFGSDGSKAGVVIIPLIQKLLLDN